MIVNIFSVVIGILSYIVLAVFYIAIRQQTLLNSFHKLNFSVINSKNKILFHWISFCRLNQKLTVICRSIKEYSRFCGPFLCIFFPFYIIDQRYFGYIVAFSDIDQTSARWLFNSAILECNIILFALTNKCAVIAKLNNAFERYCRVFVFYFNQKPGSLNVRDLIKSDQFVVHKRLQPYTFKVFANYRINSKTYYLVITF